MKRYWMCRLLAESCHGTQLEPVEDEAVNRDRPSRVWSVQYIDSIGSAMLLMEIRHHHEMCVVVPGPRFLRCVVVVLHRVERLLEHEPRAGRSVMASTHYILAILRQVSRAIVKRGKRTRCRSCKENIDDHPPNELMEDDQIGGNFTPAQPLRMLWFCRSTAENAPAWTIRPPMSQSFVWRSRRTGACMMSPGGKSHQWSCGWHRRGCRNSFFL
jgi:hypothetical protein